MPLPKDTRDEVTGYVLKHVVPKTESPRPKTAMEWFVAKFGFISDQPLKQHLAEAFYQARFAGRLQEALNLKGGFNHLFIKSQILLYASIFEALIDHFLEANKAHPIVKPLFQERTLRPVLNVLSSNTRIVHSTLENTFEITPCREILRPRTLKEVRFNQRLTTAVSLGIIPEAHVQFIESLYTNRNSIHLLTSAARNIKPDSNESSEAFRVLFRCLEHLQNWKPPASSVLVEP